MREKQVDLTSQIIPSRPVFPHCFSTTSSGRQAPRAQGFFLRPVYSCYAKGKKEILVVERKEREARHDFLSSPTNILFKKKKEKGWWEGK